MMLVPSFGTLTIGLLLLPLVAAVIWLLTRRKPEKRQ
jgi:hypothetical protein